MPKHNIAVMLILGIVTCGIYTIYWMYQAREEFRNYSGRYDINPGLELLLCLLCFPYYYYWVYKFSSDIAAFQASSGRPVTDNSALNLIIALLGLGWLSDLLIQDQLNKL